MPKISLKELNTALKLFDTNINRWSKTLRHPDTGRAISRQAIYRALEENGPQWIIDSISAIIAKARSEFPEYYYKKRRTRIPQ